MGGEGCFWKPFRVAGMCVAGRGSGPGGQEGPAALPRCHLPQPAHLPFSVWPSHLPLPSLGSLTLQRLTSWAVGALAF